MTSRDEGRERGRPARTTLAQPRPSPRPGSTGSGATIPLSRAHGVLAGSVTGCRITGKRSGHPTQRMRARRPRSRRGPSSHPSCSARRDGPCRCGRAVPLGVSSVKRPIVNQDEPRRNTNGHEYGWTCWLRRRHGIKAGSAGVPPAQHWHGFTLLSHPARPARAPRFRFSRAHGVPGGRVAGRRITGKRSGHPTQRMRARRPRSRRGASSHPSCSARRHSPCRCGRAVPLGVSSVKRPIVNKDEPRRNTNGHEYGWTCWLRRRHGIKAGSAGVPPAQQWHSFTPLLDPARPATAPGFCLGRAHAVPGGRVAGRRITGNGAATQRRGCGRDARAPGGGAPPILPAPRGGTAPADAAEPFRLVCLQ